MNGIRLAAVGWTAVLLGIVPVPAAGYGLSTNAPTRWSEVVIVRDRQALTNFDVSPGRLPALVERGLTQSTGKATAREAWLSLIEPEDQIGIKVFTAPGPTSGTRPDLTEAVVKSLLEAGFAPKQIIVWDRRLSALRLAGYLRLAERHGVRVAGSAEAGYDDQAYYEKELLGRLVWGDHEFGSNEPPAGRKSYVSSLVTRQMTRIVSIAPLLNHNLAAISGHLYSLTMGSVDNTLRFETDATQLAEAVPEILALEALADRLALCITDALICQYEGEERQLLHYSAPLGELWFSRDPVALDSLGIEELERQRKLAGMPLAEPSRVLYENAALLELGVSRLTQIRIDRWP